MSDERDRPLPSLIEVQPDVDVDDEELWGPAWADDICPDCYEPDGRCIWDDEVICPSCGMPNCPGYCDDYQTYNLRPAETGGTE